MTDFRHETKRLILRDWREDDWDSFWSSTNTPAVMEHLGGVLDDESRRAAQSRLLSYKRDHGHTFWAVEKKPEGEPIGFCGLKRCNQEGGPLGAMEVGWRLAEAEWGKGYAREAAAASLDLAFNRFDAQEVIALTIQSNKPSWGLMLRLGMERREDLDFPSDDFGQFGTIIVYSIDRKRWSNWNV